MKRRLTVVLFLSVLITFYGCATSQDIAKKKTSGEAINVQYDYPWEKVYDTYKYVLENSAVEPIVLRTSSLYSHVKYLIQEKTILIMVYSVTFRDIELAIYFTPESEKKTKVTLVKGLTVLGTVDQDDAVKLLFEEVDFVLKNKGQGYSEYTFGNSAKWDAAKKFK
jgi:hypothetical protein